MLGASLPGTRGTVGVGVGRLLVALDPGVGVSPVDLAVRWDADAEARSLGAARVEAPRGEVLVPGLVELVVIPLAVNLASNVLYDLVRRLVRRSQPSADGERMELEVTEITTGQGDRVVVVRSAAERS